MSRYQKWLLRGAVSAGLWLSVLGAHAAAVAGWVAPGGTTTQVGSTIRVQFAYNGLSGVAGSSLGLFDIDVRYSSNSLRFLSGSFDVAGPGSNALEFSESGASPFFGDFLGNSASVIDVFALSGNSQAVLDAQQANDLLLFELVFEALAVDATAFVGIDLLDPFLLFGSSDPAVTLSSQFQPAQIDLDIRAPGGTPVPEPSTLLLLALAGWAFHATRANPRSFLRSHSCA